MEPLRPRTAPSPSPLRPPSTPEGRLDVDGPLRDRFNISPRAGSGLARRVRSAVAVAILMLACTTTAAQAVVRSVATAKNATDAERYAASQLRQLLYRGQLDVRDVELQQGTIYVGDCPYLRQHFGSYKDSLCADGYLACGDGRNLCLYGAGEKGTLYAVYAYLESIGYRLYTPSALVVPDVYGLKVPQTCIVSNPSFAYREVSYYYPNHSRLYADWHHLNTQADRHAEWGMFVHTFNRLLPPDRYFDDHPEWFSLNNGRRSRDGQLCLSNPRVLTALCQRLADTMATHPEARIWSVSPNDNYNVCQCADCRRMDSVFGGPSGTLLAFVNQVARRFPDKVIATLAYQYTRTAPTAGCVRPDSNVLVMLCPIEAGRELPIATSPLEASFRKDMADWDGLTDRLFLWDYVVQFRNFWTPFPNLHVLQPNLQFFHSHGVSHMFEQASGADNITSWMDIRCYMIAKLLWNVDMDMDSVMADFYQGYYGASGRYVKAIVDTMTAALVASGQRLDIYGYPVDGAEGYLSVGRMRQYDSLMALAWQNAPRHADAAFSAIDSALLYFQLALDYARNDLAVGRDIYGYYGLDSIPADISPLVERLEAFASAARMFSVPWMMEMGISPEKYVSTLSDNLQKRFGPNKARHSTVALRHAATAPYNGAALADGVCGIIDYRHDWLGFWGDTVDATLTLGASPIDITSVRADFYFFPLSWIFLPKHIECQLSSDGINWQTVGEANPTNPEVLATPSIYTYQTTLPTPQQARYVRLVATPLAEIPSWHRAAGQKPWLFTDEIIVR